MKHLEQCIWIADDHQQHPCAGNGDIEPLRRRHEAMGERGHFSSTADDRRNDNYVFFLSLQNKQKKGFDWMGRCGVDVSVKQEGVDERVDVSGTIVLAWQQHDQRWSKHQRSASVIDYTETGV